MQRFHGPTVLLIRAFTMKSHSSLSRQVLKTLTGIQAASFRTRMPCAAFSRFESSKGKSNGTSKVQDAEGSAVASDSVPLHEIFAKQKSVAVLLDTYERLKCAQFGRVSPVVLLQAVAQSTDKSVKQSYMLMSEPALNEGFRSLLNDVTQEVRMSLTSQDIACCMLALAKICQRQKVFLDPNETDIELHSGEDARGEHHAPHLQDEAVEVFNIVEGIILSQGRGSIGSGSLATILWSYAETQQGSDELFQQLREEVLLREIKDYTEAELCQILWSFTKVKSRVDSDHLFEKMHNEILRRGLVGFETRELPLVLSSFVNKQQGSAKLFRVLEKDILTRDIRVFNAVDISRILWSFAKVKRNVKASDLLERFTKEILRRGASRFDDRGIAVMLWSLIELNHFSKELFTLLKKEIRKRNSRKFVPHDISIFLWSFAKVKSRIDARAIFAVIDKEIHHRGFAEFSGSELAMTMWALAESGQGTRALFVKLKKEILVRNVKDFNPVGLSQVVWCMAKGRAKVEVHDLFDHLSNEIVTRYNVMRFTVRQLSLILWSFAICGNTPVALFKTFQREITRKGVRGCSIAALCQIMYSLAEARDVVDAEVLVGDIENEVLRRGVGTFDNRQLAIMAWSFAERDTDGTSLRVVDVLKKEILRRSLKDYMPADVCRIMWAFAKAHLIVRNQELFVAFKTELTRRGLSAFSGSQLAMAMVALSEANELSSNYCELFRREILSRNARTFEAVHLCSFARSFSSAGHEAEYFYVWTEEEVICRGVTAFRPRELVALLQCFIELERGGRLCLAVKEQLLSRELYGYSAEDIGEICSILERAGIETVDILSKFNV